MKSKSDKKIEGREGLCPKQFGPEQFGPTQSCPLSCYNTLSSEDKKLFMHCVKSVLKGESVAKLPAGVTLEDVETFVAGILVGRGQNFRHKAKLKELLAAADLKNERE